MTKKKLSVTVILVVQNLQGATPSQRGCLNTLLRSCSYLVSFVGRRMKPVIKAVANDFFSGEKFRLLDPFESLLKLAIPYNYIVVDFITDNTDLQVRERGLTPNDSCYAFTFPS